MGYTRTMNTAGYWLYWLFLYTVVCVLAALSGAAAASSLVYNYDHSHHLAHYFETLNAWEWAAALGCAAPGFACVGLCQFWDYRKKQPAAPQAKPADADETVWPPAPRQ